MCDDVFVNINKLIIYDVDVHTNVSLFLTEHRSAVATWKAPQCIVYIRI